jgi:hypothetical protein
MKLQFSLATLLVCVTVLAVLWALRRLKVGNDAELPIG